MDPAQGETGGKTSLTSKLISKHPRVKDKVKSLKNRFPGMKKHTGEEEDSSEHDDNSPRGPVPETGYNAGESTPFSTVKTGSPPSPRGYVSRPSGHDTGYDAGHGVAPQPTRPAPAVESPRSHLAPSLEEKFKYLDVGEKSPRYQPEQRTDPIRSYQPDPIRSYQPEQQTDPTRSYQPDPIRSYQPEQQTDPTRSYQPDPIRSYQPEQQTDPTRSYQPEQQTDPIRSYQPEQQTRSYQPEQQVDPNRSYQSENQQYSPSTTESVQKGYSDVSYRARPTTPTTPNKGMLDKVRESVAGAAVVLGDKVGYYNDTPAAPTDPNAPSILDRAKSTLGLDKPRDPYAPSLVDKTKATLGLDKPRDPYAPTLVDKTKATLGLDKPSDPYAPTLVDKTKATLGLDKPRDPNAPPLTEKAKAYVGVASQKTREYGATAADRAAWTKDRLAAQTTPTQHDKDLSDQVTQTLSTLPGVIREKVFGPASPTTSPRNPGVMDRVSGAVSSFFNTAPQQTAERMQHTFPAHSDYPGAHARQNPAGERMGATSSAQPSYPTEPVTYAPPSYESVPASSHAPPSYPTGNY